MTTKVRQGTVRWCVEMFEPNTLEGANPEQYNAVVLRCYVFKKDGATVHYQRGKATEDFDCGVCVCSVRQFIKQTYATENSAAIAAQKMLYDIEFKTNKSGRIWRQK